jgi:transposase InsO family protein
MPARPRYFGDSRSKYVSEREGLGSFQRGAYSAVDMCLHFYKLSKISRKLNNLSPIEYLAQAA